MEINTHGIMRGGIHVIHGWIIPKFNNDSVLYYNNIRNPKKLDDRLITKEDTRIQNVRLHISSNPDNKNIQLVLKSFESKTFDLYKEVINNSTDHRFPINILIIRNPYNNLASSLAYNENNGDCPDVKCDREFIDMWKYFAAEFLNITNFISNKLTILYDVFIIDKVYREKISVQLGLCASIDNLNTLYMGGGSSFTDTNTSYHDRYKQYEQNSIMLELLNDPIISEYWNAIQKKYDHILSVTNFKIA